MQKRKHKAKLKARRIGMKLEKVQMSLIMSGREDAGLEYTCQF